MSSFVIISESFSSFVKSCSALAEEKWKILSLHKQKFKYPSFRKLSTLQISVKTLVNYALPKKFLQQSQILHVCFNVMHSYKIQDYDNTFEKIAFVRMKI